MKIIYEGKQDTRLFKNMIGETIEKIMEADDKVVWYRRENGEGQKVY